jgi:1-deoxy-D-xylulose-5-phosphate synthase
VEDPCRFHSPSAYRVEGGRAVFDEKVHATWTETFADALIDLARDDERVVALTAAMPDGTGLAKFREVFPERCIDVGIGESHAVAMAAGLAKAGQRPVVAIYSTFMQRAMDQIFQEVSLQNLPVVLAMDRAGLVGSDGAVHHGFMDLAFLRPLPHLVILAPADAAEMHAAMKFALAQDAPLALRYPRDEVPADLPGECPPFELGRGRVVREGEHATLLCYGATVEPALLAAEILQREAGLEVAVINARFAKPLDTALITSRLTTGRPMVICEEHVAAGGFGSGVLEMAASRGLSAANVRLLSLPDRFIEHAARQQQLTDAGLTPTHIAAVVKDLIPHRAGTPAK